MVKRANRLQIGSTALLLACASMCAAQANTAAAAQDAAGPTTTLRVTSRMVEIAAVVRGKDGAPLTDLKKEDFILKQDGEEVAIRYFEEGQKLPLTFALLVDTSSSQRTLLSDEVLASDIFFRTMLTSPQDRATLVAVDAGVTQLIPMTDSAAKLHLGLTGLNMDAVRSQATRLNDAVFATARITLNHETGRKAIVILSDGGENASKKTLQEAIEEAQRGNVQIYSVLYTSFDGGGSLGYGLNGLAMGSVDAGEELLKKMSVNTGGRLYRVGHGQSLRSIFEQIAQDLRLQYEIGYTPPPTTKPNSFHKLDLRVKEKQMTVQARNGFYAGQ